jgi:hypothetical protein
MYLPKGVQNMAMINLFRKPDSFLAAVGIFLGILITLLYLVSPTIHLFSIGLSLILSCSLYIIIVYLQLPVYPLQHITKNEKKLLDITFLLLFSLSLIITHNLEYRPPIYFLLYSLCAGSIAVSIYFSNTKMDYFTQYLKIILLSFNITYSIFNLAGFIPGIDPWAHAKMNFLLSQTGNIEVLFDKEMHLPIVLNKEMYFPIMHVQVAVVKLISSVSIRDASNFAIIIPFVFASSFVYLVSKEFLGHRVGLFALLLVNISDYHIYWASAPQTTSYGLILYYLLVYTLVKSYFLNSNHNFNPKWVAMSIFFIFILIITHAVSSFIFLITVVSLFAGSIFYAFLYEKIVISKYKNATILNLGSICLLTLIALLQQWFVSMYTKGGRSLFDQIVSSLYLYINDYADFLNRPETISTFAATMPPFIERFADTSGFSLFLFFGIIGSLYCLSDKYRSRDLFSFIFVIAVLFGITFSFPLFGMRNIIPSRWFAFEYFFLSILASFSILKLSTYFKSRKFRSIFVSVVFISTAFFMSASTISNLDSPLWLKTETVSTTYTLGEVRGAETLSEFGTDYICDSSFGESVISVYYGQNCTVFNPNEKISSGNIFIWRSYMEQRPIRCFTSLEGYYKPIESTTVLGKDFHSKLTKYNKIYYNKDLSAYYI